MTIKQKGESSSQDRGAIQRRTKKVNESQKEHIEIAFQVV